VRDFFDKKYDPFTARFYYVNSASDVTTFDKPKLLGDEDLDLCMYLHRNSVCKITASERSGAGILVSFRGMSCLLTANKLLPTVEEAAAAIVQFNFCVGEVSFYESLDPDSFFYSSECKQSENKTLTELEFTLIAMKPSGKFEQGGYVQPIQLDICQKRMTCSDRHGEGGELELVRHNHGDARSLMDNAVLERARPLIYFQDTCESGGLGSGVFRHGALLAMQVQLAYTRFGLLSIFLWLPVFCYALFHV
jgi:hypothetical protein